MATTAELYYAIGALTAERSEYGNQRGQAPLTAAITILENFRDNGEITEAGKSYVLSVLQSEKLGEYGLTKDRESFVRSIAIVETIEVPTAE